MNTAKLPFPLPASLSGVGDSEQGRAWLAELPLLLRGASEEWQLELGEPFPDAPRRSPCLRYFVMEARPS
jgi:hypothetical protein